MENEGDFNDLEKAILSWCSEKYKDLDLASQLKSVSFKKREWTKVGFYTYFEVPKTLKPVDFSLMPNKEFPIDGPLIESTDIELGGGTLLWGKDGYIDCIEMYANGSFFRETISDFKLKDN